MRIKRNTLETLLTRTLLITFALFVATSCGLNRQANSMKALRQCKFELVGLDSLTLAGTDILQMLESNQLDVSQLPGVALSFLSGELPMVSVVKLQVHNPTRYTAGMRQFQYEIFMDGESVVEGTSDLPFAVSPRKTDTVTLQINANVYRLISNRQSRDKILALLNSQISGETAGQEPKINLSLRIKPTIGLGNTSINYPGSITIHKVIDRALLSRL